MLSCVLKQASKQVNKQSVLPPPAEPPLPPPLPSVIASMLEPAEGDGAGTIRQPLSVRADVSACASKVLYLHLHQQCHHCQSKASESWLTTGVQVRIR